jgi:hypothetical protein
VAASSSQRAVICASAARLSSVSLPGGGQDPARHFPGCGRWWRRGDGSVLAELGGEPAQSALAAAVAAFA